MKIEKVKKDENRSNRNSSAVLELLSNNLIPSVHRVPSWPDVRGLKFCSEKDLKGIIG